MAANTDQHDTARSEAFGYVCHACSRCCHHKLIQVNPYEIARLAQRAGQSSSEFRTSYTVNGTALRQAENGACIFLGAGGCTVHADRPLVCRLYPLGRRSKADGTEEWTHAVPHPQSEGEYNKKGTIAEFIAAQGALPFMRAADGYAQWVRDAYDATSTVEGGAVSNELADDLLDMDTAISAHCRETGAYEPAGIEERRVLHMEILYRQLHKLMGGNNE
jgi:uncharacterized protein